MHPYHSDKYPVVFSHFHYMKTLFEAVGPEQVSPHYESLSRSRRGLLFIFFYIGTINSIARLFTSINLFYGSYVLLWLLTLD